MYVHKTPPSPPQNNPFLGLHLKVGEMNYRLGHLDPKWAKCLKSGQNFLGVGQKSLFMEREGGRGEWRLKWSGVGRVVIIRVQTQCKIRVHLREEMQVHAYLNKPQRHTHGKK